MRFSLLNLVFLMTFVAMAVALWKLNSELVPLRVEVRRLRDEVGELYIEDPTKLHAIRVDSNNELEWKWRIWIPKGARYRLRGNGGPVAAAGYPNGGGTIHFHESGEVVVRYRIQRDPRDGKWYGSLHSEGMSVGRDEQPWVEWKSHLATGGGVGDVTCSFDVNETVDLIRRRVSEKAKNSTKVEDPAAGFQVWLEPMP